MKTALLIIMICIIPLVFVADSDGDGVEDEDDHCPSTSLEARVYTGGPSRLEGDHRSYSEQFIGCDCEEIETSLYETYGYLRDWIEHPAASYLPEFEYSQVASSNQISGCVAFSCSPDASVDQVVLLFSTNLEFSSQAGYCPENHCRGTTYYEYPEEFQKSTCQDGFLVELCQPNIYPDDPRCAQEDNAQPIAEPDSLAENRFDIESYFVEETLASVYPSIIYPGDEELIRELFENHISADELAGMDTLYDYLTITKKNISSQNSTTVLIRIEIKEGYVAQDLRVYESIPKAFAERVAELSFSQDPIIIKDDPLIMWHFDELGDRVDLSYSVNRSVGVVGTTVVTAGDVVEKKSYWNIIIPLILVLIVIVAFLFKPTKRGDA